MDGALKRVIERLKSCSDSHSRIRNPIFYLAGCMSLRRAKLWYMRSPSNCGDN